MDTRIIKGLVALLAVAYTVYLYSIGYTGSAIGMTLVSIVLILKSMPTKRNACSMDTTTWITW